LKHMVDAKTKAKAIDTTFKVKSQNTSSFDGAATKTYKGTAYNPKMYPKGPFKEVAVAGPTTATQKKVMGGGFFSGVSKATHALDKAGKTGLRAAGRGVKAGAFAVARQGGKGYYQAKASTRGVLKPSAISNFKKKAYESQAKSLERRQNLATYRSNIASQKLNRLQAKTVAQEARLKQLEIKRARREFLKSQRASSNRRGPLSDKGFTLPRKKKPSFF
jgi:hypothetical protein